MDKNIEVLRKVKLFDGIDENLEAMLQCLGGEVKTYDRGKSSC